MTWKAKFALNWRREVVPESTVQKRADLGTTPVLVSSVIFSVQREQDCESWSPLLIRVLATNASVIRVLPTNASVIRVPPTNASVIRVLPTNASVMMEPDADQVNTSICPGVSKIICRTSDFRFSKRSNTPENLVVKRFKDVMMPPFGPSPNLRRQGKENKRKTSKTKQPGGTEKELDQVRTGQEMGGQGGVSHAMPSSGHAQQSKRLLTQSLLEAALNQ